jgi:hypothetical protein
VAVDMLLHVSFLVYVLYTRDGFSLVHYLWLVLLGFVLKHFCVVHVNSFCKNCLSGRHASVADLIYRNTDICMHRSNFNFYNFVIICVMC